jgi:hypothetical protein
MNYQEASAAFRNDVARLVAAGIILPDVTSYLPAEFKRNYGLAMDAAGTLSTSANSGVPALLTTMIDPTIIEILFAPNKAAEIIGENQKGSWLDDTIMFPVVEHTGEVSSYGDFNENGHSGANTNWPNRQSYLFQVVKEYGERELERAGLAKLNWVSEIDKAAATVLNKFQNLTYFFGVAGLQNYGLINDPLLPASLTPGCQGGKLAVLDQSVDRRRHRNGQRSLHRHPVDLRPPHRELGWSDRSYAQVGAFDVAGCIGCSDRDQLLQRQCLRSVEEELPEHPLRNGGSVRQAFGEQSHRVSLPVTWCR